MSLIANNSNINTDTIFVHFAGSTKPWQTWADIHKLTKIWLSYKEKSPWYNQKLLSPQTYKQAKFMAKILKITFIIHILVLQIFIMENKI